MSNLFANGVNLDDIFHPRGTTTKRANVNIQAAGSDISNRYASVDFGTAPGSNTGFQSGGNDIRNLFAALGTVVNIQLINGSANTFITRGIDPPIGHSAGFTLWSNSPPGGRPPTGLERFQQNSYGAAAVFSELSATPYWMNPRDAVSSSLYEVTSTIVDDSGLGAGILNGWFAPTWYSLGSSRSWSVLLETDGGAEATVEISIRNAATLSVLTTAQFTMSVWQEV
jgi:hypothetical protein